MKSLIRLLNTIVAICCILIIIFIFWFLYLIFAKGFGGVEAARYITSEVTGLWDGFFRWFTSLFT